MNKFKHWLIRKLGGCLPDEKEIRLTKTVVKPVKVSAVHEEFAYDELKRRHPVYDVVAHIERTITHKIVERLINLGLIEVEQSYDDFTGITRFTTSIEVIPQQRSKDE